MIKINEIKCKTVLNKSRIPGVDFALNPYVGCSHKCLYCYAVFMKRFTGHTEPWGDFVDVKTNASEVLGQQLRRLKKSRISFGTVCDPYQQTEEQYKITRRCLEALTYYYHSVSILTKSPLVLRDLDLLKKTKDIEVGFTITTLEPEIKEIFEPFSPSVQERLEALKNLSQNKIPAWVFVAPLLPHLADSEEKIEQLFTASENAGARSILFDTLNPYPKVWNNVINLINKHFPDARNFYDYYYNNKREYEIKIKECISRVAKNFKIEFDTAF